MCVITVVGSMRGIYERATRLSRPGSDVFERGLRTDTEGNPVGVSFFQAMDDMVTAVASSDQSAMQRGVDEFSSMTDSVSLGMAQIGSDMDVVESQQTVIDDTLLRLKTLLYGV